MKKYKLPNEEPQHESENLRAVYFFYADRLFTLDDFLVLLQVHECILVKLYLN